jgi:hypothetical protein
MNLHVTGMMNNKATKEQSFRVEMPASGSEFRFLEAGSGSCRFPA